MQKTNIKVKQAKKSRKQSPYLGLENQREYAGVASLEIWSRGPVELETRALRRGYCLAIAVTTGKQRRPPELGLTPLGGGSHLASAGSSGVRRRDPAKLAPSLYGAGRSPPWLVSAEPEQGPSQN